MKLSIAKYYPASTTNYSMGREQPIKYFTVHHSAGWESTLRYLWADPSRNGSSHFWVGNLAGQIEQYVDTDNTAWTNGNWRSNNESITCEIRGDWRNNYYDKPTLDNLGKLLLEVRKNFPNLAISFHKDVSDRVTLCPADLKDKGYAKVVWDEVSRQLAPPPKPPTIINITYQKITPKRIQLIRTANLWQFNFTKWGDAQAVKSYGQGSVIDVVAVATNSLGGKFYMTAYSYNNGAIRATHGFNIVDCKDYVPEDTKPPVIVPKWEAMLTPRKMRLVYDNYVIDLDTMKPVGDNIKAGTDIALVQKKTDEKKRVWVRSAWAKTNSKNWGIPLDQFTELPEMTEPPTEPVPEPPIDTNPNLPGSGDAVLENTNTILKILTAIAKFFGIKWE